MKSILTGLIIGSLAIWASLAALAADHEAGVPLTAAEAVGAWTLETGGRNICVLTLGQEKRGQDKAGGKEKTGDTGFSAHIPPTCGDTLPAGVAGWAPAAGGMSFVGANGQTLIGFSRWSNSLFVSHRSSGVDIQLKRGGPNP